MIFTLAVKGVVLDHKLAYLCRDHWKQLEYHPVIAITGFDLNKRKHRCNVCVEVGKKKSRFKDPYIRVKKSSHVVAYAYDEPANRLWIKFKGKATPYEYTNIDKETFDELHRRNLCGESVGKYIHEAIAWKTAGGSP